jgi:serine phosphatase RsbU (regulator of sigma subunit)/Tfp pilus assembly protein PilF
MKGLIPFLIILIGAVSNYASAQTFDAETQHQLDSLNAVLKKKTTADTSKVNTLIYIANIYYLRNPDKAVEVCKRALAIAKRVNFATGKSEAYGWLGYLAQQKGDIKAALEYSHECLKISEDIGDIKGQGIIINNIGYIHRAQGDLELALEYFHKSLVLDEKSGNEKSKAITLNNIGLTHSDLGDRDKALEYYHKSIALRKKVGDQLGMATSLNNLAAEYRDQGDLEKALEYFQQSLTINQKLGDKQGIATASVNIGGIYSKQNNVPEAKKYAQRSLDISTELGYPADILIAAKALSQVYVKENDGMKALEMYQLYITMRDSINNEENQKAVAKQQAKYAYEKQKAIDDVAHEKQIALKQEEKEKQQILTYAAAAGLALVVLFLLVVFNRLKVTRQQKRVIEKQKSSVETAHQKLEEKNKEILDSINYAKRIQSAILPPMQTVNAALKDSFILYKPKDIVAGDFYWLQQADNKVLFAAADCTGHGVPGAMVSVVCNNGLNRAVREHGLTDPGQILDKTREIVVQEFDSAGVEEHDVKDGMDIALCALNGNQLQYAGANNPLWIVRKEKVNNEGESENNPLSLSPQAEGEAFTFTLIETKATKQPIGKVDNPQSFQTHTIELQQGDTIYIFSDGFVDQFGGRSGKKFKAKAFKELLLSIQEKPMDEQRTIIDDTFENWRGDLEQVDDVCVIGVKVG